MFFSSDLSRLIAFFKYLFDWLYAAGWWLAMLCLLMTGAFFSSCLYWVDYGQWPKHIQHVWHMLTEEGLSH